MQENIIQFKKQKLFKNANYVDLKTGEIKPIDILVENEKIYAIEPWGEIEKSELFNKNFCEVIDLEQNYVMQPFINAYCDSEKAFNNTYDLELLTKNERLSKLKMMGLDIKEESLLDPEYEKFLFTAIFKIKSVLSGCVFEKDMLFGRSKIFNEKTSVDWLGLEKIDELSEKELDETCLKANEEDKKLFIKFGQTLSELGTIDKRYSKPASYVLEDFGLLDKKPVIVGGNCLEKDDLQLLKNYDCSFVVTPFDDGRNGRRPTNIISLKSLDFDIAIGSGESFEIDFFAYMRQILMNMRSMFEDKDILTEQEVLNMAIRNAQKICFGKVWEFKVGRGADFIVIKKENSLYDDIFKTLVWTKSKKDVLMTVFMGEILQKNGEILMKNMQSYDKIISLIKHSTKKIQH